MSPPMRAIALGVHVVDVLARPVEVIPEGQGGQLVDSIRITAAARGVATRRVRPRAQAAASWTCTRPGSIEGNRMRAAQRRRCRGSPAATACGQPAGLRLRRPGGHRSGLRPRGL